MATSANATTITTTQDKTLYESSFQNFGFYAQGRYWVFYEDTAVNCENMGGCLFYTSSTDGALWSTPVNVGIHVTDSDWSITTDGSHAFYVRYDENWFDSFCNRALLFGTGSLGTDGAIVWQTEQTVRSPNTLLRFPNDIIKVDTQGQAWIGYQEVSGSDCGGTGEQTPHIVHSSSTDYSVWTGDYLLSTAHSNNWDIDIATLPGGSVYAEYWISSLDLHGALFNGTSWGPDEQVSSPSDSTDVNSFIFAQGNSVNAIWYDSNREMLRFGTRQSSGQWTASDIGDGEARSANSLSRYSLPITATFDPSSSRFYVFWYNATNKAIDEWSGSGGSWTKTSGAFATASAVGEYTISSYSQSAPVGNGDAFGVMWVDQPSSPYNLNFGLVTTSPQPQSGAGTGTYFDHVVIVVMENEGVQNICGGNPPPCQGASSPYMSQLANTYTVSSQYTSINPGGSQPNYVALISGSTFNCTEESCPTISAPNLVDRLESTGLTWKAYMENQNLQSGCDTKTTLLYEYQHNPFLSFADILNNQTRCSNIILANPNGCSVTDCTLINDLNSGSAPNFMWLTPNDCNNMHGAANNSTFVCSPSISTGDNYLGGLVPNILNSSTFTNHRSALFVVFDEGTNYCPLNGAHEDCVYATWTGPLVKTGFVSSNLYNHYSFLRTIEANWNLPSLTSNDASAIPMTEFFTNNVTPSHPSASFSYSPASPQAGQPITFTGSASGGVSPYTYSWNFGDSSTGSGSSTTHTYQTAGDYSVILTVRDSTGQNTSATQSVTISSPPALTTSFTFSPSSPQTDQQIMFTGYASGGTAPYIFSWNFGDGATGTSETVNHSYSSAGTFTVVLTVNDNSSSHQTATSQQTITLTNPPPPAPLAANFSYTPNSPEINNTVTLSATVNGGTGRYAFGWSFGDGTNAATNPTTHIYGSPGSYTVVVIVTDANGASANYSRVISVASVPNVSFTYNPSSPEANSETTFTAFTNGGVQPYSYSWSFGDSGTSSGSSPTYTYQASGSYTIVLIVTDANGVTAKASQTITVNPPLSTSFSYSPSSPLPLLPVQFTANATGGSQPYSYSWNFGDGSTGSGATVNHSYLLPGTYIVTLTTTDNNGQTATASTTVSVGISLIGPLPGI